VMEAPVDPDRSLVSGSTVEVLGPVGAGEAPVCIAGLAAGRPRLDFAAAGVVALVAEDDAAGAWVSASCAPEPLADWAWAALQPALAVRAAAKANARPMLAVMGRGS
jgi:hypothetical protein